MPNTEKSILQSEPSSRTELDLRLAERYGVAARTVRLWRRKGAPLDEPDEMPDWITDNCQPGKKDGAEVRAARIKKLALQIEGLTLRDQQEASGYLTRTEFTRLYAPMMEYLRETVRELLLTTQPPALASKSEPDVRVLTKSHFDALLAEMSTWCRRDSEARQAAVALDQPPSPDASDKPDPETHDASKGKRGRVADPEMEALRLRKLTLECAVLERENRVALGDLLPLQGCLHAFEEHLGPHRRDLKNLLLTDQPASLPGRTEAAIRMTNQQTFNRFSARLRTSQTELDNFLQPSIPTTARTLTS